MRSQFTSYEQLPITLTADHVAAALGISRANAYILLRSDGFPTLHIGKRMVVPKDRFLQWFTLPMYACCAVLEDDGSVGFSWLSGTKCSVPTVKF